jgi:hypothetical protein
MVAMNAEIFAEWFRRQGYHVVRTPSSYWYEVNPRVYQAFPYQWVIEPQEEELLDLLRANRAIALRYSAPLTASQGQVSYHVVCEGPCFDLASLPRRARQSTRRGLKYANIEPVPLSRLASEGWRLRRESLERQGRAGAESEAWWRRLCLSAEDLPGFEAWGAIHDGELVASFLAFVCDNCYTLPHEQSSSSHLEHRVNNAIFYAVTHQALERSDISEVFFCLQSLDAPASVDQFKFRMGYTPRPVRQRVVFHPWLAPVFNQASHVVLKRMLGKYPDRPSLAKAEGMLRFYLEGRRPISEQDWPDVLTPPDQELLGTQNPHARA